MDRHMMRNVQYLSQVYYNTLTHANACNTTKITTASHIMYTATHRRLLVASRARYGADYVAENACLRCHFRLPPVNLAPPHSPLQLYKNPEKRVSQILHGMYLE